MDVIKYVDAAKIAGVSRQAIYDLKKINIGGKRKYPFFIFNPENGKAGVNIEDPSWKDYLDRNRNNPVKKKSNVNRIKQNSGKVELEKSNVNHDDEPNASALITAVVSAIKETFDISKKELDKLLNLINEKYQGGV